MHLYTNLKSCNKERVEFQLCTNAPDKEGSTESIQMIELDFIVFCVQHIEV